METDKPAGGTYLPPTDVSDKFQNRSGHRRRRHRHTTRLHIPLDAVVLSLWYFVLMPLGLVYGYPQKPAFAAPCILCWLSFLFGFAGTVMLLIARKPLYRVRHFVSWRPSNLPEGYWRLFFVSRIFIAGSVLILLAAFVMLGMEQQW